MSGDCLSIDTRARYRLLVPIYVDPKTHSYSDRPPQVLDDVVRPNLPDRVAKGPNTVFRTIDAAAADALDYARAEKKQFVEYGGWIIKAPGGGFTYEGISSVRMARVRRALAPAA